jgi:hypothetical protein
MEDAVARRGGEICAIATTVAWVVALFVEWSLSFIFGAGNSERRKPEPAQRVAP